MKKKDFDCVELQHEGGRRIYEETKNLTFEEKVEYWRQKSEEMALKYKKLPPEPSDKNMKDISINKHRV